MKFLPSAWHQTYPVRQCRGDWCQCYFQAKPRHKHPDRHLHCHVHSGQLRPNFSDTVPVDVFVFQSQSEARARRMTSGLTDVQTTLDHHPELKRSVVVAECWAQRVDSVGYLPGQKKTVAKEDTVVVQERVMGQTQVVEYHDDGTQEEEEDVRQVRREHPVLARLVDFVRSGTGDLRALSYLKAVLDTSGMYHVTCVAFRGADRDGRRGQTSQEDVPDGCCTITSSCCYSCQPLEPSAPQLPEVTASEVVGPTAPEPEVEPTAPEPEVEEPAAPEEEDYPPPPYCECVDTSGGMQRPPPYRRYEDPPPPYSAVDAG
ncbi:uncharacterized protein LOC143281716 [Babylonia areolata]|uniref:uncharacterized protein LOC143281716 n=1 Tax=Babylonia areolata TaxID=304850 RepID=UPI003FD0F004